MRFPLRFSSYVTNDKVYPEIKDALFDWQVTPLLLTCFSDQDPVQRHPAFLLVDSTHFRWASLVLWQGHWADETQSRDQQLRQGQREKHFSAAGPFVGVFVGATLMDPFFCWFFPGLFFPFSFNYGGSLVHKKKTQKQLPHFYFKLCRERRRRICFEVRHNKQWLPDAFSALARERAVEPPPIGRGELMLHDVCSFRWPVPTWRHQRQLLHFKGKYLDHRSSGTGSPAGVYNKRDIQRYWEKTCKPS